MALPQFQSDDVSFGQLQNTWKAQIDPLLANPLNKGNILKSVALAVGSNTVNHLLGRNLQGWFIVRQRAAASIYDAQDGNTHPELTLTLVSDAVVTVDLAVF